MFLRSITLSGFKTFARTTEIRFEGGVTAIVGPNGSGKSNTVDAFKWVLGETQAKDLRGKKMEEVIYAGGERRSRASTAEVTILIDNSDHRLPVDFQEVAIRRRVDRTGQSDYFLNGARVRRRDLMDLLASTGLTTDSYAIVDQRDIEGIISASPEHRRLLIEEAAQVRGVKAKRSEAAGRLRELAANLVRLEDLRTEIEPRLEVVRAQAAASREADLTRQRLEVLKGSIVWEEWREARDAHRRATTQAAAQERRLAEANGQASSAEDEFRRCREELQSAQDRRLQRQREIGSLRLELSVAEHDLAMAEERAANLAALAAAAESEDRDQVARAQAAAAVRTQLAGDLEKTEAELAAVPAALPEPEAGDAGQAREARQVAEQARRQLLTAQSSLAAARTRRQFLEESLSRLQAQVDPAEAAMPAAEEGHEQMARKAAVAAAAAADLARLEAELEGLNALRQAPQQGLQRVGDVIVARPGYEAALSAVLGPLVDAWAAPSEAAARRAAATSQDQATVLYPGGAPTVDPGSLLDHVICEPGFGGLAAGLLGRVVIGRDVSLEGVFSAPGLVRAGSDPRVRLAARRRELAEATASLRPLAASAQAAAQAAKAAAEHLNGLRAAAGQRPRLDETARHLDAARRAELAEAAGLPALEAAAVAAEAAAGELASALGDSERRLAEHRAEVRRLELEGARWRDRAGDLRRQLAAIEVDLARLAQTRAERELRAGQTAGQASALSESLPGLRSAVEAARARLAQVDRESPEEDAELAATARRLVNLEESRVEARLRATSLEGQLGLSRREAELAAARMEELRERMPQGMAPEEVPGGKAREREMRQLERRLEEIGPTNPLAQSECAELEERTGTLATQLEDLAAARADLEILIGRLREEEESRYDAVFGAVTVNFQEYFAELTGGGKATLRHTAGEEGPRSGVEILVQPPRKRMQNVTLLSSGERALTALGLVLALQEVNPAAFTILDEVDAALDDANVGRFSQVLQRLARNRQFLVITHNHMTMAGAGILYGVHLDESGSSHLVSVRLEDISPARRAPAGASA